MRVFGSVIEEESGRPLEGLLVRVFDKDLIRDDRLGDTRTNANGQFELSYTEAQYRDLHETLPDLYLRVYDRSGEKLLHTTEREVRWNASVAERFEIRIPRARLSGA